MVIVDGISAIMNMSNWSKRLRYLVGSSFADVIPLLKKRDLVLNVKQNYQRKLRVANTKIAHSKQQEISIVRNTAETCIETKKQRRILYIATLAEVVLQYVTMVIRNATRVEINPILEKRR
jgi:hypothetical protein